MKLKITPKMNLIKAHKILSSCKEFMRIEVHFTLLLVDEVSANF
jgi:hypothetical protein